MSNSNMSPITEDDIANFLVNTPDFFVRHAETLGSIRLSSPHGNRAVSLQERQAELMREKIKGLELRIMDMMRSGGDYTVIAKHLHNWTKNLLQINKAIDIPDLLVKRLEICFDVPQAAVKVWDVSKAAKKESFAKGVSEEVQAFASALPQPYCGPNTGFEAVDWLPRPQEVKSLALIPLRACEMFSVTPIQGGVKVQDPAIGLLVLASDDEHRYHSGMGTLILEQIGELASSSLARLRV
jgi:uncharacterized protein YigA (DUF484 family)